MSVSAITAQANPQRHHGEDHLPRNPSPAQKRDEVTVVRSAQPLSRWAPIRHPDRSMYAASGVQHPDPVILIAMSSRPARVPECRRSMLPVLFVVALLAGALAPPGIVSVP